MTGPMTCRPQFRGGYTIYENGRAIGALHSREAAELFCAAINAREPAGRQEQEDAAWAAHRRAA